jgi:TonB family protein
MAESVIPSEQPDTLVELPPHARLPRLDLGIDWESTWEEFPTSVRAVIAGPRPPKDSELPEGRVLRAHWIRGKKPGWEFAAACGLLGGIIWFLTLPIWGFLPKNTPTLAPVQIELTWYGEPQDLPKISLPAATPKSAASRKKPDEAAKATDARGADAFHPRQTILSIPVRVTHPRQTLIRPDAPNVAPKVVPQLPNIVQWSEVQLAKPKFQLEAKASAPQVRQRAVRDTAAPEVPNAVKNQGPLDIAAKPAAIARPQMPLSAMSAPAVRQHEARTDAAAPEIGAAANDSSLRNVIALSATPGPPMPVSNVPEGNLAARISISPAGTKPGTPGGAEGHSAEANAGAGGGAAVAPGTASVGGVGGNASSLPAAISISGGAEPHASGGGIAPAGSRAGRLNLTPATPYVPSGNSRKGPINVAAIDPSLPPEKILSGSEVYTLHIDLPNLTSASGSWILHYSELDEDERPGFRKKERLAAPVPVEKSDPKYPPELIKGHVQGEVVLYAIIRKDGAVDSIQVVRGLDPQLDRNAIEALEKWKFLPAARAGSPVDVEAVIQVPFIYRDPRDYGPR